MQRSLCRGPASRIAICVLLLGIAADLGCAAMARAQEDRSQGKTETAPLPPIRPPTPAASSTPPSPQQQAPDQQATEATPDWHPGKLLQLPPYTRPRMHECALEWQKMKASGAATEKIWYTFAKSCLVR